MIRVAIVGAGIGAEHLAAYRALPELFDVTLICDLDTVRAEAMAGSISITPDLDDVLGAEVDIIDICLPPHLHVPVALRALEAGKHVICEKPLACSLLELDQLEAAAKRTGLQVFPVFQYRFGPGLDALRHLIKEGHAGRAISASFETHWSRDATYYDVPWRGTWAGEQGGCVVSHAIHAHDLLTHLLGDVAELSAQLTTRVNEIETDDTAAIAFRMTSGALASSSVTLGAARDETRIKLIFEHVTAESGLSPYAPASPGWSFVAKDPAQQEAIDKAATGASQGALGFEGFLTEVARAFAKTPSAAVTLQDGRRSLELITAIYQSAREKSVVRLPMPKDAPLYGGWQP